MAPISVHYIQTQIILLAWISEPTTSTGPLRNRAVIGVIYANENKYKCSGRRTLGRRAHFTCVMRELKGFARNPGFSADGLQTLFI